MDIRQMQWFAEVARVGSFNRAAENLFITRQALSKAVARLETETGRDLLEADHRGVRLTSEGAAFLEEIEPLLASYAQIEARYRTPGKRSVLEIALGKGTIYPFPDDFVEQFAKRHPEADVRIEEIHSVGTLRMVEAGDAEIGILCTHPKYLDGFETLELMHPGYAVFVPQDNPMASCDRMEQCEKAGVNPQIVASTSDMGMFEQTRQRASALTFACTPGPGGTCAAAKLIPLDMEDADKFGSYAIRRRDVAPSPLGKAFWETMREYAARELRG